MIIRCWGARGSIPVSGKEYLKYGGSTTCLEVRTNNDDIIIVDAGSGIRKLGNKLLSEGRYKYSILFTHSHWDHLIGFPFFKPLYVDGTHINLYGCPRTQKSIKEMVSRVMIRPNFPVNFENIKSGVSFHGACQDSFHIESMMITPIFLSHPGQGIGFKFVEDNKFFVFLTDNEITFKHPGGLDYYDYLRFTQNADLLFHDAEYTEEEYEQTEAWGHTVYTDALKLALEAEVGKFGLFHHNQERTDPAIDGMVQHCVEIAGKSNVELDCFAVREEMEIRL
jgi:phosphoribosyl 1,2-cyclic phosphodiesterase